MWRSFQSGSDRLHDFVISNYHFIYHSRPLPIKYTRIKTTNITMCPTHTVYVGDLLTVRSEKRYRQSADSEGARLMGRILKLVEDNWEMTPTGAFYAKRIVDMGAATLPVIFLLFTNKEIQTAMGLQKLSDRIANVRPGQLHNRRISAVALTATVQ